MSAILERLRSFTPAPKWLVKSEPETWSWAQHVKVGIEPWNGVRNYQAQNFMKQMKLGERAFFYHSVSEKAIVGIVEVVREWYPDPEDEKGVFGLVDFRAVEAVTPPIRLAEIKSEPRLESHYLIRQSRLSVMPGFETPR